MSPHKKLIFLCGTLVVFLDLKHFLVEKSVRGSITFVDPKQTVGLITDWVLNAINYVSTFVTLYTINKYECAESPFC
jgi:hypothetical protein